MGSYITHPMFKTWVCFWAHGLSSLISQELLPPHSQLVSRVQFAAEMTAKLFEEIVETQQSLTGQ